MEFEELIQSSLTKNEKTALKYFWGSKTDVMKHHQSDITFVWKLSVLSDPMYRIKLVSPGSAILQVVCHILTQILLFDALFSRKNKSSQELLFVRLTHLRYLTPFDLLNFWHNCASWQEIDVLKISTSLLIYSLTYSILKNA